VGLHDDAKLRRHLVEIQQYARGSTPARTEVRSTPLARRVGDMAAFDFAALAPGTCAAPFDDLRQKFRAAVPPNSSATRPKTPHWQPICAVLIGRAKKRLRRYAPRPQPEFFLQGNGSRWADRAGELIFDS
jgi:hypothetical protein